MYRRLAILSGIILSALCGLSLLGYHAIEKWAQGLEGARFGDFAEVAEQIRQDVDDKFDEFIRQEQNRQYTDYFYYHVPDNVADVQQQMPVLRSPLSTQFDNEYASGYFQIEPGGALATPYFQRGAPLSQADGALAGKASAQLLNVKRNVLPALTSESGQIAMSLQDSLRKRGLSGLAVAGGQDGDESLRFLSKSGAASKGRRARRSDEYQIKSLQEEGQKAKVLTQPRAIAASNVAQEFDQAQRSETQQLAVQQGVAQAEQQPLQWDYGESQQRAESLLRQRAAEPQTDQEQTPAEANELVVTSPIQAAAETRRPQSQPAPTPAAQQAQGRRDNADLVKIRIEPFVPLVVPNGQDKQTTFGGQVFLLRHVQIEDKHFVQGFALNEEKLIAEVAESAGRFMREGMTFEIAEPTQADAVEHDTETPIAHTAILDFGFGDLLVHLKELDPGRIPRQIAQLRNSYTGIIVVAAMAVMLALVSLWRNARAQLKLAEKKDDFISAVSHELRTPLTSIRMYAEMLEKNWVKSKDKLSEYYRNMRAESERLSRLVENVLDFSRLQKGRKRYSFAAGDINQCVGEAVDMMRPYAQQQGFSVQTELGDLGATTFDKDAVTQIVVNLLDNGIKYGRADGPKTIFVRTARRGRFTMIEVEDRGPGVPRRQRKRIFEQFYRCSGPSASGAKVSGPKTTGTGLGLALVKRFAEAHNGFVEVASAEPSGAIFRVGLAGQA